jgi:hypothetical protein
VEISRLKASTLSPATSGGNGPAPRVEDEHRGVAQHFAVWRNDDSVRFALRTREPEKAQEIIGVLRGWLRAARLSLRDVWINGRNHHGS